MGIIIPKASSSRTGEGHGFGDRLEDVGLAPMGAPPAPESTPSLVAPDAWNLQRADYPRKDLPKVQGSREPRYQIVFKQSVLEQIRAHGRESMEAEVCGVLVGDVYSDQWAPWGHVEHCIRGNGAVGKETQVTITSETWTRIHEVLERDYPGKKIIGWYHTHPGFGIFLSGMDLFIQENFFNQPWNIATVYDPKTGEEGTFVWRGGKTAKEHVLIENDMEGTPPVPEPGVVKDLEKRIARLERRLDVILTTILFAVLLALVAPLIIYTVAPDTVNHLPFIRQLRTPPATQPATQPTAPAPSGNSAAAGASGDVRRLPQ